MLDNMMNEYKTIIWDFNGTIIDDVNAALGAVNDMLLRRNQNTIDLQQYRDAIDTPIWNFYLTVFDKDTITMDEAVKEFDSGVDKHLQDNPLMDEIRDVFEYFADRGKQQIIVSSSHINKVNAQLDMLGVSSFFSEVLALSDYYAGSKVHLADDYFTRHNINPCEAVVIGDSVADFQMACKLGCDCILNTRGHQCREALENTGVVVIDSLSELIKIIN